MSTLTQHKKAIRSLCANPRVRAVLFVFQHNLSYDYDNGILRTYFHVRNSHSFPEVQITSRSGNAETESKYTLRLMTSLKDRDVSLTCNG